MEPPPPPTKDSMELIGGEHLQGSTVAYSSKTSGQELIGGILGPEPAPIIKDEKDIEAPECKFRRGKCITHGIKGEKKTISIKK